MSDNTNAKANNAPIHKEDEHGVHYDVWRKTGKYGPFYEIERYKPYRDKQTGEWKKSHMFSDRDVLVAQRLETKVLKEVEKFKQLDKEVAARYKQEYNGQQPQQQQLPQTSQNQPQQQSNSQEMDHAAMQQAQKEAYSGAPQQQPEQAHDRPHEPSR